MRKYFPAVLIILIALAAASAPAADFTGNGRDDIAVFRPLTGLWAIRGYTRVYFGTASDIPAPGKWTQGARDQIAVFRPSSGLWAVHGGPRNYFGTAGDIPLGFGGGSDVWAQTGDGICYWNGNVAIGTTIDTSSAILALHGNSSVRRPHLRLYEADNDYARINFHNINTESFFAVAARPQEALADARLNFYHSVTGDIMTITGNGRVGIGTSTPRCRLHVRESLEEGWAMWVRNAGGDGMAVQAGSSVAGSLIDFYTDPGGWVGGIFFTGGNTTHYATSSDERLKENIADADGASALIDAIRVRQFDWKASGDHTRYGLVAQELAEVFPEAVSRGNNKEDTWGVDYSKLVPMLLKEIQDQRKEIGQLRDRISRLEEI